MAEYIALLRVGQLMLVSIFGFGCIYLGYKLFSQIPIKVTNEGQFKIPSIGEAKLKIAPGVFFAVVGAVVLYSSIDRNISITNQLISDTSPSKNSAEKKASTTAEDNDSSKHVETDP